MTPDDRALAILGSMAMRLQLEWEQLRMLIREHINEAISEDRAGRAEAES